MSKIFNLPEVRNHAPRVGYDLSERTIRSMFCGALVPIYHRAIIPFDHFRINYASFTRTLTLNKASFGRFKEYFDWFFVPYSTIWRYSDDFLSNVDNDDHAVSPVVENGMRITQAPSFTLKTLVDKLRSINDFDESGLPVQYGFQKLLDNLGYGSGLMIPSSSRGDYDVADIDIQTAGMCNLWNIAAYQAIYQNFYRNDNWEFARPSTYNFDYLTSSGGAINSNSIDTYLSSTVFAKELFHLRYADYPKDMFTGIFPNTQYGNVSVVSSLIDSPTKAYLADGSLATGTSNISTNLSGQVVYNNTSKPTLALQAQISILDLRRAEALQRWKEIQLVHKKNYKSQMEAVYGGEIPYRRSNSVEYLGGSTNIVNIQDVTSSTENDIVRLGELAGKGLGAADGQFIDREFKEHGVLMCIYHVMPVIEYSSNMLEKENTIISQEDYYNPLFANIGLEKIRRQQFGFAPTHDSDCNRTMDLSQGTSFFQNNHVLGYGTRYIEYKTAFDKVFGSFGFGRSLKAWCLAQNVWSRIWPENASNPMQINLVTNYQSFKCYPYHADNTFISNAQSSSPYFEDADQFYLVFNCDIKAVRPIDADGMPY